MSWVGDMVMPQLSDDADVQRNLLRILLVTSRYWGLVLKKRDAARLVPRAAQHQRPLARGSARVLRFSGTTPRAGLYWAW
ncbi:hypothetical protein [Rhodoferax sp. U11-2br]|uniref:hypothetical protein n=1 Tax=Rhodoferax sp. U11-2br TaxID=2838878 RepID=UPI001BE6081B|nr:hypothetical protein [Rhodoferax sp. U11-2br]MBT3065585.1 hypothetical protein [Rhodoferax sp. U11-2br]